MTRLCEELRIPRGITSFVGGGGKTSLINRLAVELCQSNRVLRLTTTRIYPPSDGEILIDPTPDELEFVFERCSLVTAGCHAENGKLKAPSFGAEKLAPIADYVLIEADGSRGLPLKAPNEFEPVFCGMEKLVIAVAGASGFGKTIIEAAHRPELYSALVSKSADECIAPCDAAAVLMSRQGQRKGVQCRFVAAINQCDSAERIEAARKCATVLQCESVLLSLKMRPDWYEFHSFWGR